KRESERFARRRMHHFGDRIDGDTGKDFFLLFLLPRKQLGPRSPAVFPAFRPSTFAKTEVPSPRPSRRDRRGTRWGGGSEGMVARSRRIPPSDDTEGVERFCEYEPDRDGLGSFPARNENQLVQGVF